MCNMFTGVSSSVLDTAIKQVKERAAAAQGNDGCRGLAALLNARPLAERVNTACGANEEDIDDTVPEPFPRTRPGDVANVLCVRDGRLARETMTYGYPASWNKGKLIYNARFENALRPGSMWNDSLAYRRCLIPITAFYEPDKAHIVPSPRTGKLVRQQVRFTLQSKEPAPGSDSRTGKSSTSTPLFFLAGIYENARFAVVTCAPNASVAPVHDRMPIALRPEEASIWLGRAYTTLADRSGMALRAVNE